MSTKSREVRLRKQARDEIDRLIRFLDESDNHMEREPDDEGDDSDIDPSLGSFDRMSNQSNAWRQSAGELCFSIDAEQDGAENEASLGSLDGQLNQEPRAFGWRRDLEQDDAETGIADQDGLDEQIPFRDWQHVGMV
jgi:hypothetical protein